MAGEDLNLSRSAGVNEAAEATLDSVTGRGK
jgi:hypothetical protein